MSTLATLILLCAALMGGWLVFIAIRRRQGSLRLGLMHAAMALTGTGLLFAAILTEPASKPLNFSALFLILALVGGTLVFALREPGRPPSMLMVTAHAIFGLIGISILAINLF